MSNTLASECGLPPQSTASPDLRRVEIEACLRAAADLPGIDTATCQWLSQKLSEQVFNLVAAGQFKRGKSTVINALLGEPLVPAGVVPLTSVITVIQSGRVPAAYAALRYGEKRPIEITELAEYVTERGNPGNMKSVERVVIEHPSPWLADGVRLVDTPGIASVYEHNTDETRRYLPQADAVLFIASVDQPVSRAELDFLRDIRRYAGKIFCLLNKTDYLRPDELNESLAFSVHAVREALGSDDVPVFPVSARLALEAKMGNDAESLSRSGFPEFERALRNFMAQEKTDSWLRSLGRGLERLLTQARFALDLESKALIEPLDHIEANLALFREEKERAERARADYSVLLEADARALLKQNIEPKLEQFKRAQKAEIRAAIDRWVGELAGLPSRKLQAALAERKIAAIRAAYDDWLAQEDVEISHAFQRLCARFWASLQQSVDELMRRSSELFCIDFDRADTEPRWSAESGLYYKFWYEPTSLKILSTSAVLMLPRLIAAPLIAKRAKTTAVELIEVQAGRIRHDLDERLKKSVQDAQRQMLRQIDATVAGIEGAIEGGVALRGRSAEQVAARGTQLESARREIAALLTRLHRIMTILSPDDKSR
ncbi:MAG: dynamin family protein [Steroidobacteraceae bacterium]